MSRLTNARKNHLSLAAPYIHYLLPLLPFSLFVLSFIYGAPSDLLECSLEGHWSHLFRVKDENAIRTIEHALRCCGLNSPRDRAWPFPSHDVDVGACERMLGYTTPCMQPLRRQEQVAAGLIALASIFNFVLLVGSSTSIACRRGMLTLNSILLTWQSQSDRVDQDASCQRSPSLSELDCFEARRKIRAVRGTSTRSQATQERIRTLLKFADVEMEMGNYHGRLPSRDPSARALNNVKVQEMSRGISGNGSQ